MGLSLAGPVRLGGGSGAERLLGRGHRAPHARGGVVGAGSPVASSGQGLRLEHRCGEWEMTGKEGGSGLTEAAMRQRGGGVDAGQRRSGVGDELWWSVERGSGARAQTREEQGEKGNGAVTGAI
jgi:hypothetical protein